MTNANGALSAAIGIAICIFFNPVTSMAAKDVKPNFLLTDRAYKLFDERLAKEVEAKIAAEVKSRSTTDEGPLSFLSRRRAVRSTWYGQV